MFGLLNAYFSAIGNEGQPVRSFDSAVSSDFVAR